MFKVQKHFLINQNLWFFVSSRILINNKYLYTYIFLVKKVNFWISFQRRLFFTEKSSLFLIHSLSMFESFQIYFSNFLIFKIYLITLNPIYFLGGVFKIKVKNQLFIFKKMPKYLINKVQEKKITSFFKKFSNCIADYKRPTKVKVTLNFQNVTLNFPNQINKWKVFILISLKLKCLYKSIIINFQNFLNNEKNIVLNHFKSLNTLILLGLIFRPNVLKLIKKTKKKLYFLDNKLDFLKNQFFFIKSVTNLEFSKKVNFFIFLKLKQICFPVKIINFFYKENQYLQFFLLKEKQNLIFYTFIYSYQIKIYNEFRVKYLNTYIFFKTKLNKIEKNNKSKIFLKKFKIANLKLKLFDHIIKSKKTKKKNKITELRRWSKLTTLKSMKSFEQKIHFVFLKKQVKRDIRDALRKTKFDIKKKKLKEKKIKYQEKLKKQKEIEFFKKEQLQKKIDLTYEKKINKILLKAKKLKSKLDLQVQKNKIKIEEKNKIKEENFKIKNEQNESKKIK